MEGDTETNNVYSMCNGERKVKTEVKIEEMESEYETYDLLFDQKCSCTLHRNNNYIRSKKQIIIDELVIGPEQIQEHSTDIAKTNVPESIILKDELHECKECNANFPKLLDLSEHCKIAHPFIIKCKFCGLAFSRRTSLLRHQNSVCKINNNKQIQSQVRNQHNASNKITKHPDKPTCMGETSENKPISPDTKLHECNECDASFLHKVDLIRHRQTIHLSTIKCKYCKRIFTKRTNLVRHQRYACVNEKKPHQPQTKYECNECDKMFIRRNSLLVHLKMVHVIVTCKFCSKTYTRRSNLKRHQNYFCDRNKNKKENNETLKYGMFLNLLICDYCKNEYSHKKSLIEHIKQHMGMAKKYACHMCSKQYKTKRNLKCHVHASHLKLMLYSCEHCGIKFAWKRGLLSHKKKCSSSE